MRTVRVLAAALVLCAALAGCSGGSSDPGPEPARPSASGPASGPAPGRTSDPASDPASGSPSASGAGPGGAPGPGADAQKKACIEAVADQAAQDPGLLRTEPRPAGCEGLEDAAYVEAYYEALRKAGEEAAGKGGAAPSAGSAGG
ncbi:hypothetical protein [Streptomyces sp. cmx-4-9]|uniref:hypothetical protein n=1 Tax=Streptomyces sp. cmx-4-9 TaxID=2790941 RepID=UPI003980E0EB